MRLRCGSRSRADLGAKIAIVLLLSCGLGTATLLWTALARFLDNPLGVAHPETLVRAVYNRPPLKAWMWFSYGDFQAMRGMHSLEDIAVEGFADSTAGTGGGVRSVVMHEVSGDYFKVLGGSPQLGRVLNPADQSGSSGHLPVVLSYGLWLRAFGGASSAVGSTLSLEGIPFDVVGVMPRRFIGTVLDSTPDLWIPASAAPLFSHLPLTGPQAPNSFSVVARLRGGTTLEQAQSEFGGVFRSLMAQAGDPRIEGTLRPASEGAFALHDQFGHAIRLLLWGIATLLLMMCASVSGLMLVRSARSQRDTAVRLALGAGRSRVVVAAFAESVLLGLAGAGGGLLASRIGAPLVSGLLPPELTDLPVSLLPDLEITGLAVALALGISMIFGVIPAWFATRIAPQQVLRSGTATRRTGLTGRLILVFQTGACLVLLAGTGLLMHTLYNLAHSNPGFDVDHLIVFVVDAGHSAASSKAYQGLPGALRRGVVVDHKKT